MDIVQCQTLSSMELLEVNYNTSTFSTKIDTMAACHSIPGPFTCNGCGTTFDTSCGLHAHMTNQHSDGSFHYDHLIKTAFPKFDSCCAGTQTSKMDKKYLRRYRHSRTGKPPKKVANVTVKSEVRDKFICMNLPSDEPAPHTGEEGNQDEVALTQSVSSVPYKFRTSTRLNRLRLQDCFVHLDSLEISQFENANNVKKKAQNLTETKYPSVKEETMHVSESNSDATPQVNIDIKTHIMKQEPLDYQLSTVKRKRGRPRKIKVSMCDTTMDSEKSLLSANDNIWPVSNREKHKCRKTDITSYSHTKSNERSPVSISEVNSDIKTMKQELLDDPDYEMDEADDCDDIQSISEVVENHTETKSNASEKRLSVDEADNEDTIKSASEFDKIGVAADIQQIVKRKLGRPRKIKEGQCYTSIDNEKSLMSANDNICPVSNREKHKSSETDITAFTDSQITKRKCGTPRNTGIDAERTATGRTSIQADNQLIDTDIETDGVVMSEFSKPTIKNAKRKEKRKVKQNRPKRHSSTFMCYICGKEVWSTRKDGHMNQHMGLKPYICDVCAKAFSSKGQLQIHQKYHDRDRGIGKFSCSICQKVYVSKKNYTCHMYNHTGEKPFKCERCDAGFTHEDYLKMHTRRVHAQEKNVKCSVCDKMFFSQSNLSTHYSAIHAEPSLPCRHCGRLFNIHKVRKHHELTHTGEKQFYCIVCNHGFIQWSPYYAHMIKQHGFTKDRVMELKKAQMQSKHSKKEVGDDVPCIPSLTIP